MVSVRGSPTSSVSPYGAIQGARITAIVMMPSVTAPNTAALWRRNRRAASLAGDLEVDGDALGQIGLGRHRVGRRLQRGDAEVTQGGSSGRASA